MLYTFLYMAVKMLHWYVYAYKCTLVVCCLLFACVWCALQ